MALAKAIKQQGKIITMNAFEYINRLSSTLRIEPNQQQDNNSINPLKLKQKSCH